MAGRFGVSPAWFRVGFVLLALFGIGFVLYGLGWILIPDEGSEDSIAESLVRSFDPSNTTMVVGVVLIGIAALVLVSSVDWISGKFVVAAILLFVGVLLYRGDLSRNSELIGPEGSPDAEPPDEPVLGAADPMTTIEGGDGLPPPPTVDSPSTEYGHGVSSAVEAHAAPAVAPRPPKPRSILGRLTIAATLIALGGLALFDVAKVLYPDPVHYLAVAVGVIGGGLLIGTLFGRARWLAFVGLLLVPFLFVASVVSDWSFSGETGERYVEIKSLQDLEAANFQYDLTAGVLELDLRRFTMPATALPSTYPIEFDARVTAGELRIRLPDDVRVSVHGSAGIGAVKLLGRQSAGIGVSNTVEAFTDQPNVVFSINARADLGSVVVESSDARRSEHRWEE